MTMMKKPLMIIIYGLATFIPLCGQTLISDFEKNSSSFDVGKMIPIGDMEMKIVDNPSRTGINTSKKVLRMVRRTEGKEQWAGFSIPIHPEWKDATEPERYRYVHIKYFRTDARSEMRFKLFRQTFDENTIEKSSENKPEKVGVWEDMVFDLKTGKGNYENLSVMPDFCGARPAGITVYIDDIVFSNEPEPEMIFSERKPTVKMSTVYSSAVCLNVQKFPDVKYYEVYADGKRWLRSDSSEILVKKLKPLTDYRFRIRAVDHRGQKSEFSDECLVKTLNIGSLAIPADYSYKNVTRHGVTLCWSPVYKAQAYEIYENGVYYASTNLSEFEIKGLNPYSYYTYQIKAINEKESSGLSSPLHIVTNETEEQRNERMKWWREARFGMFIHWGVYAALEGKGRNHKKIGAPIEWQPCSRNHSDNMYGEWIMEKYDIPLKEYQENAKKLTLPVFDPDEWIGLAQAAGMKYVILGAKHHDGFCLWNTRTTDWNIVKSTPYGKDMVAQLSCSAKKQNMKFGLYFSQALDWANGGSGRRWDPDMNVRTFDEYIDEVGIPQIHELLSDFGKVDILWWDMPIEMTPERAAKYYSAVSQHYNIQKGLIQNDRLVNNIYCDNRIKPAEQRGDHNTPEQNIPDVPPTGYVDGRDWETCMTLNETWGYKANDTLWKSPTEIIRKLADIVSKGGNFLINIGPAPDGSFPEESTQILKTVGKWMEINGESIYGTISNPFQKGLPYGRCTRKVTSNNKTTLYLHVFDWPSDGILLLPTHKEIRKAYLLADANREELLYTSCDAGQRLQVPLSAPDKINSVIVVELK